MGVVAVADAPEITRLIDETLEWPGPLHVRLGKGGVPVVSRLDRPLAIGRVALATHGDVLLVSTGVMTKRALDCASVLEADGITCRILHVHTLKPFAMGALLEQLAGVRLVVTIEEHVRRGGLATAVGEVLARISSGTRRVELSR